MFKSLVTLSLAAAASAAGLNGYWGQAGQESLKEYCDSGVEYVTLSFLNTSPENDPSGYPGTNFAGHCWAGVYSNDKGVKSKLLSECQSIKESIPYCKERGVKVLLSIGGVYDASNSNYKISTEQKGRDFADFVYKAFGPYSSSWKGPRPFDLSETQHSSVDGFDFDIETELDNKPWIAMINRLRSLNSGIIITGAPQCPLSDPYFVMKDMIKQVKFDALFVQFYNNPGCDAIPDPSVSWDRFNYDDWEDILDQSSQSKNAKIYVGLPASSGAAGSGYISPTALKTLVCQLQKKKHFGGVSLWDLTRGAANVISGKSYNQHALDALKYGCNPVPTSTSTTIRSTSTTTSKTSTSTKTSTLTTLKTTTTSSAKTSSSTTTKVSSTSSIATSSSVSSVVSSSTVESTSSVASSSTPSNVESSTVQSSSTPSNVESSTVQSSSTPSNVESSTVQSSSTIESSSAGVTSASSSADPESTSSHGFPSFTHSGGWNSTVSTSATVISSKTDSTDLITSTKTGSTDLITSTKTGSTDLITSTSSVSLTTSTVYTTTVYTVTKCPPDVPHCPDGGYVTTKTIPLYTTVCPVTQTGGEHKPTTTPAPEDEIKTIYTTKIYTITSCPPYVHDCPVGSVTTEVAPWTTTVIRVTEVETEKVHKPTDKVPSPPSHDGGDDKGCGENCVVVVDQGKTTTVEGTSTIYRTVVVPPATLQTYTRPAAFTPQPKPHCGEGEDCNDKPGKEQPGNDKPGNDKPGKEQPGNEHPSGVAKPTGTSVPGGCTGAGCPAPTVPVTAGASALAMGFTGLVAMVAFQLFAL